jgi:cyclopropane fatty-acyl-phospholipid synthase-like methyltransferase
MVFSIVMGVIYPVVGILLLVLAFVAVMYPWSRSYHAEKPADMSKFITFKDEALKAEYSNKTLPMYYLVEGYMHDKLDLKMDFFEMLLNHKEEVVRMCFVPESVHFLTQKLLPQAFHHSQEMDNGEIAYVYDRGNDFYNWFLGETMVYTSGIYKEEGESLEVVQKRKLDKICTLLELTPEEPMEMLDLGCGWGTLSNHAAKYYNANVLGISLSKEQVAYGMDKAKEMGVDKKVDLVVRDYRLLGSKQYDAISCVEMSEHVGIWKYPDFLRQVSSILKDDGLFYLQIAGLRRPWQFEDLVWGIFMGTYIFPAADASCPLGWVVSQLEAAGFEVRSVDTIGIHYSWTIKAWYDNWVSNKDAVIAKYGVYYYRMWIVFLGWSVLIAKHGGSTCFQIVAHKNRDTFNRSRFIK